MLQLKTPLVSVDWLFENINHPDIIVLDATIHKITQKEEQTNKYKIPKALFFDIKHKFSNINAPFPSTVPQEEQFTTQAQKLGISESSCIIVYDAKGIYSSARAWWLLKAFGFNNVAVLNGGLPEWELAKLPTEIKQNHTVAKGDFIAKYNPKYFYFFDDINEAINNSNSLILDARSKARFYAEVPEPRKGLRSGHIPNSKNLPYTSLLDGHKLKPKTELQSQFSFILKQHQHLIFSCGSGITACILALAAEIVGYKDLSLSVYDGSWTEYGSLTSK